MTILCVCLIVVVVFYFRPILGPFITLSLWSRPQEDSKRKKQIESLGLNAFFKENNLRLLMF